MKVSMNLCVWFAKTWLTMRLIIKTLIWRVCDLQSLIIICVCNADTKHVEGDAKIPKSGDETCFVLP